MAAISLVYIEILHTNFFFFVTAKKYIFSKDVSMFTLYEKLNNLSLVIYTPVKDNNKTRSNK